MNTIDYAPFTWADETFYDVPWAEHAVTPDSPALSGPLPSGWSRSVSGPWVALRPDTRLPEAGWKIHISLLPCDFQQVGEQVISVCQAEGVALKCVTSTRLVRWLQGRFAPRTSAGKIFTLYPADNEQLARVLPLLMTLLAGRDAPRIVGDTPLLGAPVSVRFGAFRGAWEHTPSGALRRLRREGGGLRPDDSSTPEPPEVVRVLVDRTPASLELQRPTLLHRTGCGAVYRGVDARGRSVVVKEARHHCGQDDAGVDAVARLRHEHEVLVRLRHTGLAPEPLGYRCEGASDFLFMSDLGGTPVIARAAASHPTRIPPDLSSDSRRRALEYEGWVDSVWATLVGQLRAMHECGVTHGDVHPGNLLDLGGGEVRLIDFESALLDDVGLPGAAVAPGFGDELGRSPAADLLAADRVRTLLRAPAASVPLGDKARREEAEVLGERDLCAACGREPVAGSEPAVLREPAVPDLVEGILSSATPHRSDRLFPGDISQAERPDGGLGLMYGAAGVLNVLTQLQVTRLNEHLDWLTTRLAADPVRTRGLAAGVDGCALGLAVAGRTEAAVQALRQAPTMAPAGPWWGYGWAGLALASAEVQARTDDHVLLKTARDQVDRVLAEVGRGRTEHGRPGLLEGWSGVALALLRIAETPVGRRDATRLRMTALDCVRRDVARLVPTDGALLVADRGRLLPYLGIGAAGVALALAAVLDCADRQEIPTELGPATAWQVAGEEMSTELLRGRLKLGLSSPLVLGGGLLNGRSGLVVALEQMFRGDPVAADHRRRLTLHTSRVDGRLLCRGDQNLRMSTDLGTGAAGYLVALGGARISAEVLCLPGQIVLSEPAHSSIEADDGRHMASITAGTA